MEASKSFFDKQETPIENEQNKEQVKEVVNEPIVEDKNKVTDTPVKEKEVEKKVEEKKVEPSVDYLRYINENYKTEFKTPEEVGAYFEKAKKVIEYEPRLTEYENKVKQYEQQVAELNSSLNPLSYFTSQDSYIAEQLKKQRSDLHPQVLGDVISQNTDSMSDIDVLIKNELLNNPKLIGGEKGAEGLVYKRYGIDPTVPKEEWDITTQNEMLVAAGKARKEWNELKSKVVLPKIATPEEREAERVRIATERKAKLTPLQDTFSKFDKFSEQIDEGKVFDFNVPDEYKEVLPEMFEKYFVEAGIEPTKENLADLEELKQALMLRRHFKQIYKTIEGDVTAREKAARDKLLGNEHPENTNSGNEIKDESDFKKFNDEHGLGKAIRK